MTEISEIPGDGRLAGWVLYDGDCRMCVNLARRVAGLLSRRRLELAPLQSAWVRERVGERAAPPYQEMLLLSPTGAVTGGADAVVQIARRIWWAWPLFLFSRLPGAMRLLKGLYRIVARNRYCDGGRCGLRARG